MRHIRNTIAAFAAAALTSTTAIAQDTYTVGLSGALTGPAAGTLAPAIEGLRLYIDALNKAGGINGKEIRLIIEDDGAQASNAAVNVKQLLRQDVDLLINASLSSTYAPMMATAQREGVPLLFAANAVCPPEVFPPAQKLLFCSTGIAPEHDGRAAISFIEKQADGEVNLAFVAMAIPVSRGGVNFAEKLAKEKGMRSVAHEVVPPGTANFTPFAGNIQRAGANWAYSWAPWIIEVRTLEALRRQGWDGGYVTASQPETEIALHRLKDEKLYAVSSNTLFADNLPVHKEIEAAAKEAGSSYPANQMTEGWIAGMVVEEAFKQAGWPADSQKLVSAMQNLKVDTKGLRGGPIEWSEDNHFRTRQYYRVYSWDGKADAIEIAQDWIAYEIE